MPHALTSLFLFMLLNLVVSCKREKIRHPEFTRESAFHEAEAQFLSGHLDKARQLAADGAAASAYDPNWEPKFRVELSKIYLYQGESEKAVSLLRKQPCSSWIGETAIHCDLFLALGELRLGNADGCVRAIAEAASFHPTGALYGEMLGMQGSIALAQNKLDEAEHLLKQAGLENTKNSQTFLKVQVLMNLGVVSLRRQHLEDAATYFKQARELALSIGARQAVEKAAGNLGRVYYQSGDFRRARENAEAAAKQAKELGAVFDEIYWFTNAGLSQFAEHDLASANESFNRSLALSLGTGDPGLAFDAERAISYLLLSRHSSAAALHISEAERLAKAGSDRSEDMEVLLLKAFLAKQEGRVAEAEAVLDALIKQVDAQPSFQWEAENTLADLYEGTGDRFEAERWYQRAIGTFSRQRLTFRSVELELPFLENGSDLYMGYMEHLIRAGRTGEALRLLDTSRAETLAEGLGTAPAQAVRAVDPRAVAKRLGATILVYCLRPERSYLWAITGKEQAFYTLPGSGAILPLVARHNEAILGAKDLLAQKESTGRALYDALLAPAQRLLPHGGGRVVLVADSALSRLNFETLIAPAGPAKGAVPRYWIEDASVTSARSLRLLAAAGKPQRLKKAVADAPKLLLIGDPVYAKGEYAPLPNAGAEMAGIAGYFAPTDRVVAAGREASPEAYSASRPGRFRFLHFVAHATASELTPLDSAVILSGSQAGGAGAANKLYASEILKQPLSAELVTLSSCYSSGTRNYAGEGVVGLAWAFLRAGAHSVIGALWEVSDVSTPKLMDTMYARLLAGDAPDAALRAAKLEMLHSEGVFRKPVYWGAFQLYAGR